MKKLRGMSKVQRPAMEGGAWRLSPGSDLSADTGRRPAACWNHSAQEDSWNSSALLMNMMAICKILLQKCKHDTIPEKERKARRVKERHAVASGENSMCAGCGSPHHEHGSCLKGGPGGRRLA